MSYSYREISVHEWATGTRRTKGTYVRPVATGNQTAMLFFSAVQSVQRKREERERRERQERRRKGQSADANSTRSA